MLLERLEPRRLFAAAEGIIVFNTNRDGNYELYSMDPDGSHLKNLTNNPALDAIPQVSDDGTKVAFASDRGHTGNMDIWLMNIDGTNAVNITHNALPGATNWDPAASPDNAKVLYMGPKTGGGNYDIWVSDADGTHPKNLTNGLGGDFASWSDDGTKIVYGASPPSDPNNEEIYWMNADGTNKTRVTNSPGRDSYPAFTPDATKIAFMTERDGNREIYRCNLNGSGVVNLTNNPSTDQVPYYSPETGDFISFISYRDNGDGEIYVMNADGSHQTRITNNPAQDVYPGWGEPSVVSSTFDVNAPTQQFRAQFTCAANIESDSLTLELLPGNDEVDSSSIHGTFDSASHVATFTFPGFAMNALPNGNYRATVEGKPTTFYSLSGDGNRDRVVNIDDFNILATHFGKVVQGFTEGNYDYSADKIVTITDFNILAANFGKTVGIAAKTQSRASIASPFATPVPQSLHDAPDLLADVDLIEII